jgi:sugar phosphate permease
VLFMLGGGFPVFTLAWLGNRLVQSLGWAGLVKVTSRWFSYTAYGSVMAVLSLSYLFGDAISRAIMSLLLAHGFGWRGVFAAGAGLLSVILLCNLIFLRDSPQSYRLPPPEENPLNLFSDASAAATRLGMVSIFRILLSSYAFWLVCGLSLGTTLLRETFNLWIPTYFTQMAGMTGAQAAGGSALFPFFGGLSVLTAGFLSDYLGPEGRSRILFGGLCFTVVALLGLAGVTMQAPRFVPLALVATVAFCLLGPYSYLAGAMALDFGGKEGSATASGMIDGFGYLAGILSGNAMAHLAVAYGWQTMFLVLAGVAGLTSVVGGLALWQQHRRALAIGLLRPAEGQ